MDLAGELGVQSYTFRYFKKNADMIAQCKAAGVTNVELCGVHADFAKDSKFDKIIAQYNDSGMNIVSIGVQGFGNDEGSERKYFEFVKRAGVSVMAVNFSVNTTPDCFRTAEKLADEYDVNLGIHNHGGHHWLGNRQMLHQVFDTTSPRIGLCLDTAWALDSREDPVKMVKEFGDRLYGLHVKDFVFDRARKPEDVVVGTGNLDLPGLVAALDEVNFSGYAVLEYEGDIENPVPAVQKCVAAVKAVC